VLLLVYAGGATYARGVQKLLALGFFYGVIAEIHGVRN
jgi:hypothetical protein